VVEQHDHQPKRFGLLGVSQKRFDGPRLILRPIN
jgi:hypothetical protein